MSAPIRVLFVCTGNICRSPTAEGVARVQAERAGLRERFVFDSAGTHGYHVGEAPDARSVAAARARGYDLSSLRARRLASADFQRFDWLLALDGGHLELMQRQRPDNARAQLRLLLDFHPEHAGGDVPDPYYGAADGFAHVLDLVEGAVAGMLHTLTTGIRTT